MKKRSLIVAAVLTLLLCLTNLPAVISVRGGDADLGAYLPGELLVKVLPSAQGETEEGVGAYSFTESNSWSSSLPEILQTTELLRVDVSVPATVGDDEFSALSVTSEEAVWYQVTLADGTDLQETQAKLEALPEVLWVEPNYVMTLVDDGWDDGALTAALDEFPLGEEADEPTPPIYNTGDDTEFSPLSEDFADGYAIAEDAEVLPLSVNPGVQYHLDQYGIPGGYAMLQSASNLPGDGVIVAVIDTGVSTTHPDLVGNLVAGWNFSNGANNSDVTDTNGHGTHVAGIIAANGRVFGVASAAKIMPLKVLDPTSSTAWVVSALEYARTHGAHVINLSLGTTANSKLLADTVDAITSDGIVVVSATGNNNRSNDDYTYGGQQYRGLPTYPASLPNVIGVMATKEAQTGYRMADFSNWDNIPNSFREYDVMAPGTNIWSTHVLYNSGTHVSTNEYLQASGTSMAAPVVSGMVAVVKSYRASQSQPVSFRDLWDRTVLTSELYDGKFVNNANYKYRQVDLQRMLDYLTVSPDLTTKNIFILGDTLRSPTGLVFTGQTTRLEVEVQSLHGDYAAVQLEARPLDVSYASVSGSPTAPQVVEATHKTTFAFDLVIQDTFQASEIVLELKLTGSGIDSSATILTIPVSVTRLNKIYQSTLDTWYADPAHSNTFTIGNNANYLLMEDVTINAATFNIEPGGTLYFNDNTSITNNGIITIGTVIPDNRRTTGAILQPLDPATGIVKITDGSGDTTINYATVVNPKLNVQNIDHGRFEGKPPSGPDRLLVRSQEQMTYTEFNNIADMDIDADGLDRCVFNEFLRTNFLCGRITNSVFFNDRQTDLTTDQSLIYGHGFSVDAELMTTGVNVVDGSFSLTIDNAGATVGIDPRDADQTDENIEVYKKFIANYLNLIHNLPPVREDPGWVTVQPEDVVVSGLTPAGNDFTINFTVEANPVLALDIATISGRLAAVRDSNAFSAAVDTVRRASPFYHNAVLTPVHFHTVNALDAGHPIQYGLYGNYFDLSRDFKNGNPSLIATYLFEAGTNARMLADPINNMNVAYAADTPPFMVSVAASRGSYASVQGPDYYSKPFSITYSSDMNRNIARATTFLHSEPIYATGDIIQNGSWTNAKVWQSNYDLRIPTPNRYTYYMHAANLQWAEDFWLRSMPEKRLFEFAYGGDNPTSPPKGGSASNLQPFPVVKAIPRIYGDDRVATSVEIAQAGWKTSESVILVSGHQENLIDALTAASLAGQENCPIMYVMNGKLSGLVLDEIKWLGSSKVYLVGALPDSVGTELENRFAEIDVDILRGKTRFETASMVNSRIAKPQGVFIIGYNAVPDALSAASYAAAHGYIFHLADMNGNVSNVPANIGGFILGGSTLVKDYGDFGRLGGGDRYATNALINDFLGYKFNKVYAANGSTLADALPGAILAAQTDSPIYLVQGSSISGLQGKYIVSDTVIVGFGGVGT